MTDKKQQKNTRIKLVSPKATFRYPKLNEPDYGTDQYPIEGGAYSVQLVLPAEDAKVLIDKLQPIYDEAIAEGQIKFDALPVAQRKKYGNLKEQSFYTEEYDKETEEPTGNIIFKFKMKASGKDKKTGKPWSRKPTIFDAAGKPMVNPPSIWGGTVGKVSFEVGPYFVQGQVMAGISLSLNAVQIIELRSGGGGDAASHGFGAEEGYEYSEADAPKAEPSDTSDDGEEDF